MGIKKHRIKTPKRPHARSPQPIPPFWLKNLDRVRKEFQSTSWPTTAEEGLAQALALSGQGWAQLISSLKAEHPNSSARQIENTAHRLLWRWDAARWTLNEPI